MVSRTHSRFAGPYDECVVLLAVPDDDLAGWRHGQETTEYPVDVLWGPGPVANAEVWAATAHTDVEDTVRVLDRKFAVHEAGMVLDVGRQPGSMAGLPAALRDGTWTLAVADRPGDARTHVRHVADGVDPQEPVGLCEHCATTVLRVGSHATVSSCLEEPSE